MSNSTNNCNKDPDKIASVFGSEPNLYGGYTHGPYSQKMGRSGLAPKVGGARWRSKLGALTI